MDRILSGVLERFGLLVTYPVEEFRRGLIERSGLLRVGSEDRIEFLHNTFKEYLAAGRYVEQGQETILKLAGQAHDPTWQPVLRFFTALAGPASGLADSLAREVLLKYPAGRKRRKPAAAKMQRAAHLLLVQCRAIAALAPALQKRIDSLRKEFLPPHTLTDAEGIAVCGELAVPYLRRQPEISARQRTACVRALGLLQGPIAMEALRQYLNDPAVGVRAELCRYLPPLTWHAIQRSILATNGRLPNWVPPTTVTDLTPLKKVQGIDKLLELHLSGTRVLDLSPLAGFINLKILDVSQTRVADIKPLVELVHCHDLDLSRTRVSDLTGIEGMTALESLNLLGNKIVELGPIGGLKRLKMLNIGWTNVSSLDALVGLENLESIVFWFTPVQDLTPLSHLHRLISIDLRDSAVTDLSSLVAAPNLQNLRLDRTRIADLTVLKTMPKLATLHLKLDPKAEMTFLTEIKMLEELTINNVVDLEPLGSLVKLKILNCHGDAACDITPLGKLTELETLILRGMKISDLRPLAKLKKLQTLLLIATDVKDLSPLIELNQLRSLRIFPRLDIPAEMIAALKHANPNVVIGSY